MTQPMIAALIAVGVIAVTLLAVLRLMRPRQVVLPDYKELPAPAKDDSAGPLA
jgi:hypothetical protein